MTIIAGQNGTQKTTLLGMLSQTFSINNSNPFYGKKPLSGGNFKSAFSEKFKLSKKFDIPGSHEWTLFFDDESNYPIKSISRNGITRFWKKGDKSKGSGYIQKPVIYLSLSRLSPIGEDKSLSPSDKISLDKKENDFYKEWHDNILIITRSDSSNIEYLESKKKNTIGLTTSFYDWKMNSAGQDNIGKILLAILSFKRLHDKYKKSYNGGLLVIDELDATLYPASQIKLVAALRKFASNYKIQIIFTTHSLSILEKVCEIANEKKTVGQVKVVYLEKKDKSIDVLEDLSFEEIMNKLNISIGNSKKIAKIPVFLEDNEASLFLKNILKRKFKIKCNEVSLGSDNYIQLVNIKLPGLKFLESIIVLDGDVKPKKIKNNKNILLLPGGDSPERLIAKLLDNLSDTSPVWKKFHRNYTHQLCFKNISLKDVLSDRKKAKNWFKTNSKYWGQNCNKVINLWIKDNEESVDEFIDSFKTLYEKYV